jgi:hypothetical protein
MDDKRPTGVLFQRRPDPERPKPLWHPVPVSELLAVLGIIGVVAGLSLGPGTGRTPLLAGIGVCTVGVIELTVREHFSGYRSHTLLIAFLPIVGLLALVGLISGDSLVVRIALLPAAGLYVFLFRFLRGRFKVARKRRLDARAR